MKWKKLGQLMEWMGVLYFVGFGIFGLISVLVLVPKYQQLFQASGQGAIFGIGQEIVGPLLIFLLMISAATWYEGKELAVSEDLNWYDKLVALVLVLTLVLIATPQLYLAITSLIPAVKG